MLIPENEELGKTLDEPTGKGVSLGRDLVTEQRRQLAWLVQDFADVFSEMLRRAQGVAHKFVTPDGTIGRERWRQIPYH